jgi:hypothetical protein
VAKAGQLWIPPAITREEIFQTRAIGHFRVVLAAANNFFKLSKKEHSHAHAGILSVSGPWRASFNRVG